MEKHGASGLSIFEYSFDAGAFGAGEQPLVAQGRLISEPYCQQQGFDSRQVPAEMVWKPSRIVGICHDLGLDHVNPTVCTFLGI